jgi:ATP-binding cassette subfamily B (MDR/TAP) protein 8
MLAIIKYVPCFFQAGTNLFLNGMVLATLYMGGYLVSSNQVSPGEIMSFLVATQTIQRSLTQLSLLFGQMVKGLGAGARVFEVSLIFC